MGLEGVVSVQKERWQSMLLQMVAGGEMMWPLGSWMVEGSSEGQTKEGGGRDMAVVAR